MKGVGITACAILVTAVAVTPFRARTDSLEPQATSVTSTVDALFAEWTKPDSPGCGVGVASNGAVIYERGYGLANVEARIPITPASVFHVASISKQFTAMSILLLAQRGQLSLDDEVRTHVPGWAEGSRLTIRHLLTHTGGLRDAFMLRGWAPTRDEGASLNESIGSLLARQRALNFPPGAEFQYSNSGYRARRGEPNPFRHPRNSVRVRVRRRCDGPGAGGPYRGPGTGAGRDAEGTGVQTVSREPAGVCGDLYEP